MQFKLGAKVYTSDNEQVGAVAYVVIDPDTYDITHLVVRKGFLFTKDEVIPVNIVGYADGDRINLLRAAHGLEQFPEFEARHYVPAELEGVMSDAPPVVATYSPIIGAMQAPTGPHYLHKTTRNIPAGTVALKEGAKVITSDGYLAGNVDRLITRVEEQYRATHLVVAQGLVLKTWKLVPAGWISNVLEVEVHLVVDAQFFESLPEYEPVL